MTDLLEQTLIWPIRRIKGKIRAYFYWNIQGRRRDRPVVIKQGLLQACPHGKGSITGWYWDSRHMNDPVRIDTLWEILSSEYPIERIQRLSFCDECCNGQSNE